VLPGARRFKDLGVSSAKELEIPETLNLSVRRVRKQELTSQSFDDVVEAEPMPFFGER
jgi:hypothetical protein